MAISLGLVRDFSGVPFSGRLLEEVRNAAASSLQAAEFDDAVFAEVADFSGFEFTGRTSFRGARFSEDANFNQTRFFGPVTFSNARFEQVCTFDRAAFFHDGILYSSQPPATGTVSVDFTCTVFRSRASFEGIWVARTCDLTRSTFDGSVTGSAHCEDALLLREATFLRSVKFKLNASRLDCSEADFMGAITWKLTNATVDLNSVVLGGRASIAHDDSRLLLPPGVPSPGIGTSGTKAPRLLGASQVDVSQLSLIGINLKECRFAEVLSLDSLHSVNCEFNQVPPGQRVLGVSMRPVQRRVIADELALGGAGSSSVAHLYRQLRKALEDAKNEPGAGDFYYGEMEMRRRPGAHDTSTTERWLLQAYWLLSGYSLRAMRALNWLLVALIATIVLIVGLGLPDTNPQPVITGNVPAANGRMTLKVDTSTPELTLPVRSRFTVKRTNSAIKVVLSSVVFRSSGQNLTTWGTYVEMVSRFTEPVLLSLVLFALYGRIKRN